jgi:hypothetical protein
MARIFAARVALAVAVAVGPAAADETARPGPDRGIALGLFAEDSGWSYRPLLSEIAATGADHVELVVAWYQRDGAAVDLDAHPRFTAPDETLRIALRDARALSLRALVFPIVRLSDGRPGEWRGTLAPADRAAWWRRYRARVLALARLCAEEGAAALSIGSELSTLDGAADRGEWERLVREVRAHFHGTLVYSANWDHFREVAIFDLVDQIGLCAYFPLADRPGAPVEEMVRSWRDLRVELARFAHARRRPLTFTEVGYRSVRGAAVAPWEEGSAPPIDLEEQRRAYLAFRRLWQEAPRDLLAGVYFWNWYGWGGPTSRSYTPRGKPALEELLRWYGGRYSPSQ